MVPDAIVDIGSTTHNSNLKQNEFGIDEFHWNRPRPFDARALLETCSYKERVDDDDE